MHIHQQTVVGLVLQHVQRFLPVTGDIHVKTCLLENFTGDLLIDLIVLDQENPGALNRPEVLCVELPADCFSPRAVSCKAESGHDRIVKARRTDRFGQELVYILATRLVHHVPGTVRRHQDDVRINFRLDFSLDFPGDLRPFHAGHQPVEDKQTIRFTGLLHQLEQLICVGRFIHPESKRFEVSR